MAGGPPVVGIPGGVGSIGNAIMSGGFTGGTGPGVAQGSAGHSNIGAGAGGGVAGYGAAKASGPGTPSTLAGQTLGGSLTSAGYVALAGTGYSLDQAAAHGLTAGYLNQQGQVQTQAAATGAPIYTQQQITSSYGVHGSPTPGVDAPVYYGGQFIGYAPSFLTTNAPSYVTFGAQVPVPAYAPPPPPPSFVPPPVAAPPFQPVVQPPSFTPPPAPIVPSQPPPVAPSSVPPNPLSARNVLRELTGQVPGFNEVEQIGQYFENQLGFPEGFITRPPFTYPGVQGVSITPPPGSPYNPIRPPPSYLAYQQTQKAPPEPTNLVPYQPPFNPVSLAPLVGQEYCPDCDPQNLALRSQRDQVQRDLQRERSQLRQKAISRQQQDISKLEEQERLPVEYQRSQDIEQGIQQKLDMLQQIDRELQDLENQRASTRGIEPERPPRSAPPAEPVALPEKLPPIYESQPEQEPAYSSTPSPQPRRRETGGEPTIFCVGCETQNDAFRFLNGEPSKCSVIPDKGDAYA